MKNILYDADVLTDLFTEEIFDFFKNINSFEVKIDIQLQMANDKKNKIVKYISYLNDHLNKSKNIALSKAKDCIDITEQAYKNINNIISNLSVLKSTGKNIEKDFLELIVKKESSYSYDDSLNSKVSELQDRIKKFHDYSNKVDKIILSNSIVVNNFFNNYYENDMQFKASNSDPVSKNTHTETKKDISSSSVDYDDYEIKDNPILRISEKDNKVYLPYSKSEILDYMKTYPNIYKTSNSVITREYIVDLSFYTRHSVLARFRETYSLMRNREMKSILESLKRSLSLMYRYDVNPAIISGLKSESQLDLFLDCLEKNDLESFKPFKIIFEINPI